MHLEAVPSERAVEASPSASSSTSVSAPESPAASATAVYERVADFLSNMRSVNPEVVRATDPWYALRFFGRMLREQDKTYYHLSRRTDELKVFWSHSWHGSAQSKILVLLLMYNGFAAIFVGNLVALTAVALSSYGLLPGYEWSPILEPEEHYIAAPWGVSLGCLSALITLIIWRPRSTPIFLDRACINAEDHTMQMQGILSIGAMLKQSESMLVLWDTTFVERLWCIFEIAAYLQSHKGREQSLVVRPTALGVSTLAVFGLTAFRSSVQVVISYSDLDPAKAAMFNVVVTGFSILFFGLTASLFRAHFASLETMQAQLSSFSMKDAKASCCSLGHVSPSGVPVACDRVILTECIEKWFGSVEAFEESVQTQVAEALKKSMGDRVIFPRAWLVGVAIPAFWATLDMAASRWRAGETAKGNVVLIRAVTWWLGGAPLVLSLASGLGHIFRKRRQKVCDLAITGLMGVLMALMFAGIAGIQIVLEEGMQNLEAAVVFFVIVECLLCLVLKPRCSGKAPAFDARRGHTTTDLGQGDRC